MLLRSDQQAHRTGFKGKEEDKSIGITVISTKSNGSRVNEKWGGGYNFLRGQRNREKGKIRDEQCYALQVTQVM